MEPTDKNIRILSLDGGGIRGIASLIILGSIMEGIRDASGLSETPKPCEHFDLIGGTSTGGIIAIMLGRLRMTVDECIRAYTKVAEEAFTPKLWAFLPLRPRGRFSASALEEAIKQVIRKHCPRPGCVMLRTKSGPDSKTKCSHQDAQLRDPSCTKTVVLAMQTHNVDAQPELFTTYKDSTDVLSRISIWQAARATSAATTFFKPCKIPELGGLEYIDAAVGYNNPCEVLVKEAQNIFPDHRRMHILSLGTGLSRVASIGSSRSSIMKSLKKIAISTNKVHLSMDRRYGSGEEADYFRFNVDRGLDTIGLSDWKKISQLTAYTRDYVKENQRTIKHCAETFADVNDFGPPRAGIRLNKTTKKKPADHGSTAGDPLYHIPFPKNKKFVERGRLEVDLSDMLLQAEGGQIAALVGLGGSGKTQLALHLCYKIKESVIECSVLWMPAYSRDAFTQACIELTSNLGLPHEEPEETFRKYLTSRQSGNWFLVLDNADDIHIVKSRGRHGKEKGIFDYIPRSDRGRILITTRSREVAITIAGTNTVEMYLMTPGESKRLLQNSLLRSLQPKAENPEGFSTLLARLNYLPLAITQASDYINVNNTTIAEYLWLFDNTDRNQIQLLSQKIRDDSTLYSSDQAAVATTWIISFNEIRQNHEDVAVLLSFIAWIEPRNIPRFILPTAETEQQNTLAIGTLLGYGFLTRHQTDGVFEMHTFEMHSLVHTATRVWLERSSQAYNSKVLAIGWLCNVMPADWSENKRK